MLKFSIRIVIIALLLVIPFFQVPIQGEVDYITDFMQVQSLQWSPDGTRIATAVIDKSDSSWPYFITIWNSETGASIRQIGRHDGSSNWAEIYDISWSPNSSLIAYTGREGWIYVVDVASGSSTASYDIGDEDALSISWSPDGTKLVAGWTTNNITLSNTVTDEHTSYNNHMGDVTQVDWRPDGEFIVSGSLDSKIIFWDPDSMTVSETLTKIAGIKQLEYSPDSSMLAVVYIDGTIEVLDANTHGELQSFGSVDKTMKNISWNNNGSILTTVEEISESSEIIRLWGTDSWNEIGNITIEGVNSLSLLADMELNPTQFELATGGYSRLQIWQFEDFQTTSSSIETSDTSHNTPTGTEDLIQDFIDSDEFFLVLGIIGGIIILATILFSRNSKKKRQRQAIDYRNQLFEQQAQSFRNLASRTSRIRISELALIFEMDRARMYRWLLSLPQDFGFTIDDEMIQFPEDKINDSIDALINEFEKFDRTDQGKI